VEPWRRRNPYLGRSFVVGDDREKRMLLQYSKQIAIERGR